MAYTITFPCQTPFVVSHSNHIRPKVTLTLRRQGFKPRAIEVKRYIISSSEKTRKHNLKYQRYLTLIPALAGESDFITPVNPSLSDVVKRLYTCINEKNLTRLEGLISNDCFLEDSIFPHSFQGKKEVMSFMTQLVESMGENVHFQIGTICEGDELTASLDWHLEWKKDQIPFSKGCSIFRCSIEDERLVIRKAQIITETPIKPGKLALGLLKIIISLFDEFPEAAKWFLKSPQTIFKIVLKIYNVLFAPFINPVLAFYIGLWKLIVRLLSYIISILHVVSKFFSKRSGNDDPEIPDNSDSITD